MSSSPHILTGTCDCFSFFGYLLVICTSFDVCLFTTPSTDWAVLFMNIKNVFQILILHQIQSQKRSSSIYKPASSVDCFLCWGELFNLMQFHLSVVDIISWTTGFFPENSCLCLCCSLTVSDLTLRPVIHFNFFFVHPFFWVTFPRVICYRSCSPMYSSDISATHQQLWLCRFASGSSILPHSSVYLSHISTKQLMFSTLAF